MGFPISLRIVHHWLLMLILMGAGSCGGGPAGVGPVEVVWGAGMGRWVNPLPVNRSPATVWVFLTVDCPIANAYAPELRAIAGRCRDLGVGVFLVHVDPGVTAAEAVAHARRYGLEGSVVLDAEHRLVAHAGASRTPEAAVFDGAGELRYLGRIDDRFPALGARRAAASRHDLREAIEAVATGAGAVPPGAPAVGCEIEELGP